MRLLLTALVLLPAIGTAQQLRPLQNGEVADADVLNENFTALKDALLSQQHPEGDLLLRASDASTYSQAAGSSDYGRPQEEVTIDIDGVQWGPIYQSYSAPTIYTQQGISFNYTQTQRLYPQVSPPDICPEDTVSAIPVEFFRVFHNQYGAILQASNWDFGESNTPNPSALENSQSGSYVCLTGGTAVAVVNAVILGGTGRYSCATTHLEAAPPGNSSTTQLNPDLPQLDGLSSISLSAAYSDTGGFISADIPASCASPKGRNQERDSPPTKIRIHGLDIELPPTP